MSKLYIGIDPGKSGAIAFIPEFGEPWYIKCDGTYHDQAEAVRDAVEELGVFNPFAFIEKVHAMPGQGVTSMFNFGKSAGALEMLLCALKIPFEHVTPQKWQKALGCQTKGDKNVSKAKAQQLFPDLKVIHANADALLIAEYCRRERKGAE